MPNEVQPAQRSNATDILHRGSKKSYASASLHNILMDEMQTQVRKLCTMLDQDTSDDSFDCRSWVECLEGYIEDYNSRLLYSVISSHIFGKSEQEFDTFLGNLEKVMEYATNEIRPNTDDEKAVRLYKMIVKFYDHVNLANQQQLMFTHNQDGLRQQISSELEPKISEATKDMTSQLIGLVSIFTALSFLVFGGISSLDSILSTLSNEKMPFPVLPVLIVAVAWAFCLMNLLFGFMYFVLRVAHLSLSSGQEANNLVQRYPAVFLANYILLLFFVLFCGMWFAVCNGIGKPFFQFAIIHTKTTFVVALGVFLCFFIWLGRHLWRKYQGK